jgi:hypothetical protein
MLMDGLQNRQPGGWEAFGENDYEKQKIKKKSQL